MKKYEEPKIEVELFAVEEILTGSGGHFDNETEIITTGAYTNNNT